MSHFSVIEVKSCGFVFNEVFAHMHTGISRCVDI